MKYPVAAPDLSGNEAAYVAECLRSSWISSQGEYLRRFEQLFAEHTGVPHAIATCNGTVAIHLALAALDLQPRDEVIVPSLTFVATANAVTPRFLHAGKTFSTRTGRRAPSGICWHQCLP